MLKKMDCRIKAKRLLFAVSLLASICAKAQQTGKKNVDALCGCFSVEFKYAETFAPDPNYKYHEREFIDGGTELSLPIEVSDKKIIIQHLLVITDSIIIKHWREEWTYENPELWVYQGNKTWKKTQLKPEDVRGKWTQTVWEVSDEPRYQGLSNFTQLDGKTVWQNTTDAPLPRREYSVRNDYNILKRTNRINITDSGYIHEQENQKIIRNGTTDKLLVEEKGMNTYKRLNPLACSAAQAYWQKNKVYWQKVRAVWGDYISNTNTVHLQTKVADKPLHEHLMTLAKDYAAGKINAADIDQKITAEINRFIIKG
jgi:hypothetical protein